MEPIEIRNLPRVRFAHTFCADTYRNRFLPCTGFLEILWMEAGTLTVQVGDQRFVCQKGDILCAFHTHATTVEADGFHCHHTVGIAADWGFTPGQPDNLYVPVHLPAGPGSAQICRLIDGIIQQQVQWRSSGARAAAAVLELLCAIDRCSRKRQLSQISGEYIYVQRAKAYIQENLNVPIAQKALADHLGISPGYLCSVFQKTEGISPMRYINTVKLECVRALMENERIPLYQAASLYGYSDANYVSRLYKQLFGCSITQSREKIRIP